MGITVGRWEDARDRVESAVAIDDDGVGAYERANEACSR